MFAGCSSGPQLPPCYPVVGEVRYQNQPLAEAIVVLHPLGTPDPLIPRSLAQTDAAGKFKATTFKTYDGAPAGEYAITVELRAEQVSGDEVNRSGPNILPPRYARPETSGLRCTVQPGENTIPVLELVP